MYTTWWQLWHFQFIILYSINVCAYTYMEHLMNYCVFLYFYIIFFPMIYLEDRIMG